MDAIQLELRKLDQKQMQRGIRNHESMIFDAMQFD